MSGIERSSSGVYTPNKKDESCYLYAIIGIKLNKAQTDNKIIGYQ